ncbi:hypothetical protein O7599_18465 [Streptomyces sp. WMMC500]|uniref:hypothetical protein n=1 Tax=Streptomyces sp. WMMC500 TaxID=3015154 RepID=UPI00248B6C27|nr:hypothetical protein [Streptomyces sp. WMMC500]WBB57672.1 hypothetical protein O7599_18465 [Streptomyces sp. WMMC500]
MRRYAAATAAALCLAATVAAPAAASARGGDGADGGWRPVTYPPVNYPAGERCAFPFRTEPLLDEVMVKTVDTYPDGSPKTELYKGALIVRVTNLDTGAAYDADAGGSSLVRYAPDGGHVYYATGPFLIGFAEGQGNLPRGEYVVDGVYTVEITAADRRTVQWAGEKKLTDVCDQID